MASTLEKEFDALAGTRLPQTVNLEFFANLVGKECAFQDGDSKPLELILKNLQPEKRTQEFENLANSSLFVKVFIYLHQILPKNKKLYFSEPTDPNTHLHSIISFFSKKLKKPKTYEEMQTKEMPYFENHFRKLLQLRRNNSFSLLAYSKNLTIMLRSAEKINCTEALLVASLFLLSAHSKLLRPDLRDKALNTIQHSLKYEFGMVSRLYMLLSAKIKLFCDGDILGAKEIVDVFFKNVSIIENKYQIQRSSFLKPLEEFAWETLNSALSFETHPKKLQNTIFMNLDKYFNENIASQTHSTSLCFEIFDQFFLDILNFYIPNSKMSEKTSHFGFLPEKISLSFKSNHKFGIQADSFDEDTIKIRNPSNHSKLKLFKFTYDNSVRLNYTFLNCPTTLLQLALIKFGFHGRAKLLESFFSFPLQDEKYLALKLQYQSVTKTIAANEKFSPQVQEKQTDRPQRFSKHHSTEDYNRNTAKGRFL